MNAVRKEGLTFSGHVDPSQLIGLENKATKPDAFEDAKRADAIRDVASSSSHSSAPPAAPTPSPTPCKCFCKYFVNAFGYAMLFFVPMWLSLLDDRECCIHQPASNKHPHGPMKISPRTLLKEEIIALCLSHLVYFALLITIHFFHFHKRGSAYI